MNMPNFNLDGLKSKSLDCIVMGLPSFYWCYNMRLLFLVVILCCWNFAHEEQEKAYILEDDLGIVALVYE